MKESNTTTNKQKVKPIPDGYNSVTPYLIIQDAAQAINYYQTAFAAKLRLRLDMPNGKVGHAELIIGDSVIMIAEQCPEYDSHAPQPGANLPVKIHLFVQDVDSTVARAIEAGATLQRPVQDHFYGDRSGTIIDPFGHSWYIATHVEDMSNEEMQRRMKEVMG